MPWPIGRRAHNNKIDTIDKDKLKLIKHLRLDKELSYKKIANELNESPYFIFKVVKKYLGLQTHRGFERWKVL